MTSKNVNLFGNGFNLIIIRMTNNDITDNVEILCPVNSYSKNVYSPSKDCIILLKRDNFYEPIYLYEIKNNSATPTVIKSFREENAVRNVQKILIYIKNSINNYCSPLSSMPKVYKFSKNMAALDLMQLLKSKSYETNSQVMNYQGKNIGLVVKKTMDVEKGVFVPTFPSAAIDDVKIEYMENDIWKDYKTTIDELTLIHIDTKAPCKPLLKVIDENSLVIFDKTVV